MRKLLLLSFFVSVFILTACSNSTQNNTPDYYPDTDNETQDDETQISSTSDKTLEERYLDFETDLTCMLMEAEGADDIITVMSETKKVADKYFLSKEELDKMKELTTNDQEFQGKVIIKMKNECIDSYQKVIDKEHFNK